MKSALRATARVLELSGFLASALLAGTKLRTIDQRVRWMQATSQRILAIMGGSVQVSGVPPTTGLIVCNHLSYVDVLALGSVVPAVFVAKRDVDGWPVVGALCRTAGTIFVDRERRSRVGGTIAALDQTLETQIPVALFPEGTSSDGSSVLPLRTPLLAPTRSFPYTVTAIAYDLPGGSVPDEICYWRDMTFLPHFYNLLCKPRFSAHLCFGPTRPPGPDRKETACAIHEEMSRLLLQAQTPQ